MLNLFGKSVVSVAVIATFCGADAAQSGRVSAMPNANVIRMPSMPTVGLTTIGNPAVTTVSQPVMPSVVPTPTPQPEPQPDPDPKPTPDCPDGGVKNSTYTITTCMNDILQCVNTGALQGGINDLFNEDVRNSIMGGMKLCQASVDKCISEVRVNCRNVYNESNDVWLDFNSRIVQPEYYNFVLRKTGLTPNQAENTCLLLDRNTYGSSFAAVSDTNLVNTEYNNKVGAYNGAVNGTLSKDNPQGVAVNTVGYDGNRGHYARWDAAKAECLIRVAAYNKDKLITNSWLFGAVGNDKPAEVWEKAGSTFTCNKELFDFSSLLNDTRTAAVVGVGGGTLVGGAIGAAAGASVYNKKKAAAEEAADLAGSSSNDPCDDEAYRVKLGTAIAELQDEDRVNSYMSDSVTVDEESGTVTVNANSKRINNFYKLTSGQCRDIHALYSKARYYEDAIAKCKAFADYNTFSQLGRKAYSKVSYKTALGSLSCEESITCDTEEKTKFADECLFVPLQKGLAAAQNGIFCNTQNQCLPAFLIEEELARMKSLLNEFESSVSRSVVQNKEEFKLSKGKEIGKGLAIGAATGAAAGGIATAITAFVEKSNITCKIGDGLDTVALGKAHTIGSLKDFYVKWNLHLPDTVSPTSAVTDKASWAQACSQFNSKLSDCPKVQINLKDVTGKYTLVPSACKVSGSVCVANDALMASHGIK